MTFGEWMQGISAIVFALLLCATSATAQDQPRQNLMPTPANLQIGTGNLRIDSSFSVALTGHTEARLDRAVQRFLRQLSRQTAIPLSGKPSTKPTLTIHTDHASKEVQELGEDESYTLSIAPDGAKIDAPTSLGAMHALQTFLQLVEVSPNGFTAPAVTIQDKPRFPWRGLMIDVARHFIPLDVLKRNLDGLEAVKMNVFHWHLSENQGFRAESKKFPKLHSQGSDGLYYTQDEIRDLIAYARDRGIRVVPEFDMPGHSTAWFVGHPELASGPGPYEIERKWGIFDPAMDPTNEKTYKFLDEFVAEMTKLFPDHYFHIGGDEVNGKQWDASPKIQEFKKSHALKDNDALQAYFSQRIQKIVTKHGKAVVGWDEVFIPGVPKDIVIQSWRGQESLAKAAAQGYHGILSNGYYLDLGWSTARHYAVDPASGPAATPDQLTALRTLADVVEPVKDYAREASAPAEPTSATPLNRLVDAIPLESDAARRFSEQVDKFISSSCRDADAAAQLRAQLTTWRDNDARLRPLTQTSFLVKEVAATSQALSALASVGLATLDYLPKGSPAPDDWKAQQLAITEQAKTPKSQLLLMPAPAIQKLVEAVSAGGSCVAAK